MGYLKKNVDKVNEEFEIKKSKSVLKRAKRLSEVYALCPEIKEIDDSLSSVGSEIVDAIKLGKDGIDERIAKIRNKNLNLQKRRENLLLSIGFDKNYTDFVYECPICKDTGYDGVKMCKCMKNALILKGYESSGIGCLLKKQSFESFSLGFYSGKEQDIMRENYNSLLKFASEFPDDKRNFLLVGATGLGKTHLSSAVAKKLIDNGYNVVYETAQNIFFDFERDRFKNSYDSECQSDKYYECDLLIIDDLGTETVSKFTTSCLYNVINTRISKGLPIIASTNLRPEEIRKIYDDRITSRLFGEFEIKRFIGEDVRKQKIMK